MALHAKPAGGASQALKRRTVVVAASALVASVVPMAVAATPAFAQLSGAIFTTNAGCSQVNGSLYSSKQDVFLNGGPHSDNGGAGLPSNTYFVQVTDPSGAAVLGTSVGSGVERPITVGEDGSFASCYQLWSLVADAVGAEGYATTPNQGGEYKVWVSSVSTFPNDSTKTDNFKVVITPPPTDGGLRGISVSTSATSIKNVASTWTLDKSVTPGTVNGWAGGSTTAATWKVVADRTDTPTWKVSGDVVVTNAGSDPVTVTVEDTLGDAAATHPVLNCGTPVTGTSNVYAVPGTGELTCTFTDTAVTSDPVENTALVSVITGGVPGGEDVAPVVNDPTTDTASGDPSITVDDSRAAAGAPNSEAVSADTTWTYAETFPCPVPSADAVYANGVLAEDGHEHRRRRLRQRHDRPERHGGRHRQLLRADRRRPGLHQLEPVVRVGPDEDRRQGHPHAGPGRFGDLELHRHGHAQHHGERLQRRRDGHRHEPQPGGRDGRRLGRPADVRVQREPPRASRSVQDLQLLELRPHEGPRHHDRDRHDQRTHLTGRRQLHVQRRADDHDWQGIRHGD